jgi:lipopolysaccharide biosynthesis glycosyltransferase
MKFITVTNNRFAPGTYALINSMLINGGLDKPKFLLFYHGELSDEWRGRLRSLYPCEIHDIRELGEFKAPCEVWSGRIIPSIQKLLFFKIPSKKTMTYLDSDMICLSEIRDIESMGPFTVTPDLGNKIAPSINNRPQFNGGFFVFRPGRFDEMQEYALSLGRVKRMGDQLILNRFFWERYPDEVKILDYRWNVLRRIKESFPNAWKPDEIKLLHFVGEDKPWENFKDAGLKKLWKGYAWKS